MLIFCDYRNSPLNHGDSGLDLSRGDVAMKDRAHAIGTRPQHVDALRVAPLHEIERRRTGNAKAHDVGVNQGEIDLDSRELREGRGEPPPLVVVGAQVVSVVVDGVERGGGEPPRLSKPAAEHLLEAARSLDEARGSRERRAHGSAEAFREADAHRVEKGSVLRLRDSRRGRGVPEARAIEVKGQATASRGLRHLLDALEGPKGPAATVVSVLDRQKLRGWRNGFRFEAVGDSNC